MIIVFTGNGKGKTTASLGQMVRVAGRGKKALMIQFIKGPWISGEDIFISKIKSQKSKLEKIDKSLLEEMEGFYDLDIRKMGKGFVGILGDKLPREEHIKAAKEALDLFSKELASGNWDLIVLDEINVAVSLGLLKVEEVLDAIKDIPDDKFVILSGRGAPEEFIEVADLATEMREIKHPFNDGKMGKIAVEF
ncbi:MAG: cob(I)yrinic acid a,c-diamide adenosyltransferase [bacterium]|nr:cob(I)yrinic acid a,c-diamide adenosyltransferase [bacterium]